PDFQAGGSGHAVPQSAHLSTVDFYVSHVEELDLWDRTAVEFVENLVSVGTLDLEAIRRTDYRSASGIAGGALIARRLDVPAARGALEFDPVGGRCASDINELILCKMEEDAVPDNVSVIAAWREMFCSIDGEFGKRVEREM